MLSLTLVLAMHPTLAAAWGAEGHRLVAEAAEGRLSMAARSEMSRLLALEPGATLVSVSTWADEFRSPQTAPWHYLNFARDAECRYDASRSCVQGACVVDAIDRQAAVLASDAPDEQRLKALKYVVHFVADVHQPLHAGFLDDRGGNTEQLQAFGRGSNLHAVWDTALIDHWPGGSTALRAAVIDETAKPDALALTAAAWAEESCRVVSTDGFYPKDRQLDDHYARRWRDTLAQRLAHASRKLANVLNQTLPKQ